MLKGRVTYPHEREQAPVDVAEELLVLGLRVLVLSRGDGVGDELLGSEARTIAVCEIEFRNVLRKQRTVSKREIS